MIGGPAEHVCIHINGDDDWNLILAGADGMARFRALPGVYAVSGAWSPSYLFSSSDEAVELHDGETVRVSIEVEPYRVAAGVVRGADGEPAADALVRVLPVDNGWCVRPTGSDGRFELEWDPQHWNLPEKERGTAYVYARDPRQNRCAVVQFDAEAGAVDVTLEPGVSLTGRVVGPEGRAIPGALVTCNWCCVTGGGRLTKRFLAQAAAGPDGTFVIPAVSPDHMYEWKINAPGHAAANIWPELDKAAAGVIDVGTVALAAADKTISGTVRNAAGNPIRDAIITASVKGQAKRYAFSNAAGEFTVGGLAAGEAVVTAAHDDKRSARLTAEAGETGLYVMVGKSVLPRALLGKPLPDLSRLAGDAAVRMQGRPVVVCFFDVNQRPSRRVLSQLSAKADALAEKGAALIVIDASGAPLDEVKATLADAVDMPVGSAGETPAEVMVEWGVRGLPWFIVADREHIVRAEGFRVDELDEHAAALEGD